LQNHVGRSQARYGGGGEGNVSDPDIGPMYQILDQSQVEERKEYEKIN